ncbi:MAG: hypothetical protein ACQEWV_11540 [Bacillota bacterium]
MNFDDYETAKSLYKQWELLDREANSYQEEVESDVRKIAELPSDSDSGIVITPFLNQEINDTVEELEWVELIQMVINFEIPIQEIRNFVLDYKR